MKKQKILILYATRNGATKYCAELLSKKLDTVHEVTLVSTKDALPSPEEFDVVVIASSIRMGKMNKTLKKYIKEHKVALSALPTAVGFCCGLPRLFEEYVETQLPKDLVCSLGHHLFGGELKPEKLHGMDKLFVKMARNSIQTQDFEQSNADLHDLPELLPENVALLADKIKQLALE
ncbi:MAG: flavodoxin domain-containing protein [Clostridia bacterium]|nr:flavodoxin domain-containing protein [Clostridia bacterium]